MQKFLHVSGNQILSGQNKTIRLKGVNLGGWLMMEGYIMGSPNFPEHKFRKTFRKALGAKAMKDFNKAFRSNYVQESDIRNIKRLGFNCFRLPFHWRVAKEDIGFIDRAVAWAKKYKLFVILDLHGAPGCQNHDWHSDSAGKALLWTDRKYQKQTLALWDDISNRYKDEPVVAGYDLMNEAVVGSERKLNRFYKQIINVIRANDKNHILFIEGNKWATDISCLEDFNDDNYVISIHSYEPLDFTFNFVPHLSYPSKQRNAKFVRKHLEQYRKISRQRQRPILVGEFGVYNRGGVYGEHLWVKDCLECFEEFGFHWTYWTYKAIKNSAFPDGIYSYYENPAWVNRVGPLYGWDTFHLCWKKHKHQMAESWQTKSFQENTEIVKVLKQACR